MTVRPMTTGDADRVAAVYTEGIRGQNATFRRADATASDVLPWVGQADIYPVVVSLRDERLVGWARAGKYSDFEPYAGVGELAIYVTAAARGRGVGRELIEALAQAAAARGYWKLVAKVFPSNDASLALLRRCGFRDVGTHLRHGRHADGWRDVILLERSL